MRTLTIAALAAAVLHATPARAEVKLGYVDLQRALNEIDEGRAAKAKLKAEFDQKQKMLDEKQGDFNKLRTDFEKQVGVLSEDARKQRQEELDKRFLDLQSTFAQLQKELSERERDMTKAIFDKMGVIIRETAEAERLTMVFERGDSGVLWAEPALDLTNDLIRKYNARHKGAAPAAKADGKPDAKSADKKPPAEKKPADKKAASK